jgi:poly(A) polymerase
MEFKTGGPEDSFGSLISPGTRALINKVSDYLDGKGIESYLVGGLVRDALLGLDTADIDIAVAADALEVAPGIAAGLGGKFIPLDEENRVGRVVIPEAGGFPEGVRFVLDFSSFGGGIEADLARRDFTVNAMAVALGRHAANATGGMVIDPFRGRGDLAAGVIRVVSETAFSSDAVRLLRAVRLAAELGFAIEEETAGLVRRYSGLVAGVAGERLREELLRLLAVPGSGRYIALLDELGLLTALFPELAGTRGVEQPKEHYWDVLEHSLKTVRAVDFLIEQAEWEYAGEEVLSVVPWSPVLAEHFDREVSSGSTRKIMLKLAALLHDVRKPQTRTLDNGRVRFLGHGDEGAAAAAEMLGRLRFSSREIKLVETEVKHHMRPTQLSQEGMPSRRAIYRYFRDTGEAGIDILYLSLADHLATRGPNLDISGWREHARLVDFVLSRRFEEKNIVQPAKIVDGYDIIRCFGVKPGPGVGEVLEAVREAQASGEVSSREEALDFIEKYLDSSRPVKGDNR